MIIRLTCLQEKIKISQYVCLLRSFRFFLLSKLHRFTFLYIILCSTAQQSNGPELIWCEWDGQMTGWVRGITGMPDDYLTTKEVRC